MKKIQLLVIALFVFSTFAAAQDKLLTIDDIFSPDAKVRVKFSGSPTFVEWAADGKSFRQVVNGKLLRVDAVTGQAVPYYDNVSLANALMHVGLKAEDANALANSPALQSKSAQTRILVVDDEEYVRDLLRDILEKEGCEAVVAEGGHQALSLFENGNFDGSNV